MKNGCGKDDATVQKKMYSNDINMSRSVKSTNHAINTPRGYEMRNSMRRKNTKAKLESILKTWKKMSVWLKDLNREPLTVAVFWCVLQKRWFFAHWLSLARSLSSWISHSAMKFAVESCWWMHFSVSDAWRTTIVCRSDAITKINRCRFLKSTLNKICNLYLFLLQKKNIKWKKAIKNELHQNASKM